MLVTGATGYVGGRVVRRLSDQNVKVRVLVRDASRVTGRFGETVEVAQADVLEPATLAAALADVDTAYYLIHSMGATDDFESRDRASAQNFATAAKESGVRRIIYLGGLGDASQDLSPHLRSRHEVGQVLRSTGVEVIEFRASIVIGSGSLSFEMVRALAERLPVMITPRWVGVLAQPISIGDLLSYLTLALELPSGESRVFEIGGADQVTYGDMIREYAKQRGLRRFIIPIPLLTPRLSSLWLGLVTPLYARVGRALIDSIQHPTIVRDNEARHVFSVNPVGASEAIALALRNEDREIAETKWSDAVSSSALSSRPWGGVRFGNRLVDSRTVDVPVAPRRAFAPIQRIGGGVGWYFADWLWKLRGSVDVVFGGVGMRRGRRDPQTVRVGDALDFWRVEVADENRLRLRAEMKVPGRAWLEFEVTEINGGSRIRQTAEFDPLGVWGLIYWYGIYPLHRIVFSGMIRAIAVEATGGKRPPSAAAQAVALIGFFVGTFCAAAIGGLATAASVTSWYADLAKPAWTPPSWVFGPVWGVLYSLMAVAAWLVWRLRPTSERPMIAFWTQLVLNVLWSVCFFGLRSPGLGLIAIGALLVAIIVTRNAFASVSRLAGWLLVPYLLWVAYAATLNAGIWWQNAEGVQASTSARQENDLPIPSSGLFLRFCVLPSTILHMV